jgi:hypothetical protein
MDGRPEGELTLRGLHFMVYGFAGLCSAVYASLLTFHC